MTTSTRYDESFVERDEVLFPNADVIDAEPHYDNFTAIQNALRQYDGTEQTDMVSLILGFFEEFVIGNHLDGVCARLFN